MIRLLLADDHRVVLDGLCTRLEQEPDLEVVGRAHDGEQAVEMAVDMLPDVVLMDVSMPRLNGLEAAAAMQVRCPGVRVLILSMHDNREYVREALERGVAGYVLKDVSMEEMVRAIHAVHDGGTYISSGASQALLADTLRGEKSGSLTPREEEVLRRVARGRTSKEIARELNISVRTVETHRQNIKGKLGLSCTADLTRYAMEKGWI